MIATSNAEQTSGSADPGRPWYASARYASWFAADTAGAVGGNRSGPSPCRSSGMPYRVRSPGPGGLQRRRCWRNRVWASSGGTYVDRHDRKRLIVVNAFVGFLAWGSIAMLGLYGMLRFTSLLVIAVFASAVNGLLGSAADAMLRSIIDIRDYPRARSVNEGRDAVVNMAGGPVGGFLYAVRPWLPFLVSSVAHMLSGVAACRIRESHTAGEVADDGADGGADEATEAGCTAVGSGSTASFMDDFVSGWRWTLHRATVMRIVMAASLANFGINGVQYAIQLSLASRGVNAANIGLINAGICASMLLGSLLANRIGGTVPVGRSMCVAFAFICVVVVPMTLGDGYALILISNSLVGLPFPLINALLLGFVFAKAPERMQGRIASSLPAPAQALSAFCGACAGGLITAVGFRVTVVFFLAMLVAGALIVLLSPSIRAIPRAAEWSEVAL